MAYLYMSKVEMSDLFRSLKTRKMLANRKYGIRNFMRETVSFEFKHGALLLHILLIVNFWSINREVDL